MPTRYAIFYAPSQNNVLWKRAAAWLGRDAFFTPETQKPFDCELSDIARLPKDLNALTSSPRRYGFHGTLKAPIKLRAQIDEPAFVNAVAQFCRQHARVRIGTFEPKILGDFLALIPSVQSTELTEFAGACVRELDGLRAPMQTEERARRLSADLSPHQVALLDQYGYPYVMDEFRMHLTLSNRLSEEQQSPLLTAAQTWFAPILGTPYEITHLSIYKEEEAGADFTRIMDIELTGN